MHEFDAEGKDLQRAIVIEAMLLESGGCNEALRYVHDHDMRGNLPFVHRLYSYAAR